MLRIPAGVITLSCILLYPHCREENKDEDKEDTDIREVWQGINEGLSQFFHAVEGVKGLKRSEKHAKDSQGQGGMRNYEDFN